MRPARRYTQGTQTSPASDLTRPTGTFIAHVIGQFAPRELIDPRLAAQSYEAADALGRDDLRIAASL